MMHVVGSDEVKKRKKCTLFVWGCNDTSQLGLGPVAENMYEPVQMEELKKKKCIYVTAGGHSSSVLTANGEMYTWGRGSEGQLGLGDLNRGFIPQRVPLSRKKKFQMAACGDQFITAIVADRAGSVYCWGNNSEGQLGVEGATTDFNPFAPSPFCVSFFARRKVISLGAGAAHVACVARNVDGDTEVFTWGCGQKGRLGNNSDKSEKTPYLVESLRGARALQIVCGSDFTVMLSARGDVYTWGSGDSGRTGTGTVENVYVPICLPAFGQVNAIEIAAGFDHVAAITDDGRLYTWGYGSNGRLGHGEEADLLVPAVIESIKDQKITHIACGGCHTAAVTSNGLLYTFGWNHYGQLGHGAPCFGGEDLQVVPKIVEGLKSHVVIQVACGEQHTIALVTN